MALALFFIPSLVWGIGGIELSLRSPLDQDIIEGSICTASFFIHNSSSETIELWQDLLLPEGFIAIPFEEPFLTLQAGTSSLQLIAFRAPISVKAGRYSITYSVLNRDNPGERATLEFFVHVLPFRKIEATFVPQKLYLFDEEQAEISLQLVNHGNVTSTLHIHLQSEETLLFSCEPSWIITMPPHSKESVSCTLSSHQAHLMNKTIFIHGDIQDTHQDIPPLSIMAEIELFPKTSVISNRYHTIPMKTTLGYGMKNHAIQSFIEQQGGGPLGNDRYIDLFARVPWIQKTNVDRDLGGSLENAYLHIWDPSLDVYMGDGVYTATPLLLLSRFGRGGSLSYRHKQFLGKTLALQDTSSIPQMLFLGNCSYTPFSTWTCSLTALRNFLTKHSKHVLQDSSANTSASISSALRSKRYGEHFFEYGQTSKSHDKHHQGMYLYSWAELTNHLWYSLQGIYSGSHFIGYYQNTRQLYASLGFPIYINLQGSVAWNQSCYNLDHNVQLESAPRTQNGYAGLSYIFPTQTYLSLYYNYLRTKDTLTRQEYETHFASANLGKAWTFWTLQGIIEQGVYNSNFPSEHFWQNYQLYLYYQQVPSLQYAFYSKLGHMTITNYTSWLQVYGSSLQFLNSTSIPIQIKLLYEFTATPYHRHYINLTTTYTLLNRSSYSLQGYYNHSSFQNRILMFLLSYTIPWNLPFKKNKQFGALQGKVHAQEPVSHLLVHCHTQNQSLHTLTDQNGHFTFPNVKPDTYHLWVENQDPHLLPLIPMPMSLEIQGGKTTKVEIPMNHPCKIAGQIVCHTSSSLPHAHVTLSQQTSGKQLILHTDRQGAFLAEQLLPGRWLVHIESDETNALCYFAQENFFIDIFPGETRSIDLEWISLERPFELIDTGTLQLTEAP